MKTDSVRRLVLNGLMIALVLVATYFTRIPTPLPGGYFNLGDSIILLAGVFLGPLGGTIAGAAGSCLADLASGAFLFAPVTFVVKGIEGLVAGLLTNEYRNTAMNVSSDEAGKATQGRKHHSKKIALALAMIISSIIMISGYFLAEAFLLGLFDEAFGLTAAVAELVPNSLQGGLSAILGYVLVLLLERMNIRV